MKKLDNKNKLSIYEIAIFAVFGALMFALKFLMQVFPNIHPLALFIAALTICYGVKALFPLYTYVLLDGIINGFALWWIPYLYIFLPLWFEVLLLSKYLGEKLSKKYMLLIYMAVLGFNGLTFGIMYAPMQALFFGLNFQGMISWIIAGIPFDLIHGISNTIIGILVIPLSSFILKIKNHKFRQGE
ncbi:MAG: hypothetical protein LBD41_07085 [Clostridiales Family XIII bacterium]|jgi:energy-coupling factor transport system substrate-specific component|nr:hypothetical protein [Clostridiales Family XIII bacterium]